MCTPNRMFIVLKIEYHFYWRFSFEAMLIKTNYSTKTFTNMINWVNETIILGSLFWIEVKWSEVTQWCLTLCNPMDCSLPGSSVHGFLQARILEWAAILFSRGSSQPRKWTRVSYVAEEFLLFEPPGKPIRTPWRSNAF